MTKWYKGFGGPGVLNTLYPVFEAWSALEPLHYGFSRRTAVGVFEKGVCWVLFDEGKLLEFGRRAAEKLAGGFLDAVLKEFGNARKTLTG